jgi:hypothetical protein
MKGEARRCSRCQAEGRDPWHPITEFPPNKATADGLSLYCRRCKRESSKKPAAKASKAPELSDSKSEFLTVPVPRPRRPGPPSTITPALVEQICTPLRRGHTRRVAARLAGVDEDTLAQWIKRGREENSGPARELLDSVLAAEAHGEHLHVERVIEAGEIDPTHSRWFLERRYSQGTETWARKEHLDVSTNEVMDASAARELLTKKLLALGVAAARPATGAGADPAAPPDTDGEPGGQEGAL